MDRPTASINGCVDAHSRLAGVALGLLPAKLSEPSRLAGWTIGHVLAHLALNAEAMINRIEAALGGDLIDQYPGGAEGRSSAIHELACLDPMQLLARVDVSAQRLDAAFDSLPTHAWSLPVRTVRGGTHTIALLPFRRWREVEVHLVDMGVGIEPHDWSEGFVQLALPRLISGMTDRADPHDLTAWLLGRAESPDLGSWA